MRKINIILTLNEKDVKWLEKVYGDTWRKRMEQHIHNEVKQRSKDRDDLLKMRKPWDY